MLLKRFEVVAECVNDMEGHGKQIWLKCVSEAASCYTGKGP